jgi:hypothetical protein
MNADRMPGWPLALLSTRVLETPPGQQPGLPNRPEAARSPQRSDQVDEDQHGDGTGAFWVVDTANDRIA